MKIEVIRHSETTPTRWKNGMGIGRHIVSWPVEATEGEFAWQLAMAEMSGSLPFSSYPGVDRALCVTSGELLVKSQSREIVLSNESAPLFFPGEEEIVGTAIGDIKMNDFNLLTRRGVVARTLVRSRVLPEGIHCTARGSLIVHVQEGKLQIECEGVTVEADSGDTAILRNGTGFHCHFGSRDSANCIIGDIWFL